MNPLSDEASQLSDKDVDTLLATCKLMQVRRALQEWIDKQGHDRCWFYPDIFKKLCDIVDVIPGTLPCLPLRREFEDGCRRYQQEQYE